MKLRNGDLFVGVNATLLGGMGGLVYLQRFLVFRSAANLPEFFIYACAIVVVIIIAWLALRGHAYPTRLYVAAEVGILAHYAGAIITVHGQRLYDLGICGLGYDKMVHFLNAAVGAALLSCLFEGVSLRPPWVKSLVILMIVLGAGSVIEILEFGVTLIMPNSGVGDYVNNMTDLIANLTGAFAYLAATALAARAGRSVSRSQPT